VRRRFVGLPMVVKSPPYDSGPVKGAELGHEAAGEALDPATVARQASSRQPAVLYYESDARRLEEAMLLINGIRPRNRRSALGPAPAVLCQWP
jgi:hypothetical protein